MGLISYLTIELANVCRNAHTDARAHIARMPTLDTPGFGVSGVV